MSTSSTKDTATTNQSTTDPWAPQAAALTGAFNQAGNILGSASNQPLPTDFTAQMSPQQIAAFQQMIKQGGNLGIPGTQADTANTLQTSGANGVAGALSGLQGYDPTKLNNAPSLINTANQYVAGQNIDGQVNDAMLNARQTARDVTMPGIEQTAATGGNTNSTRTGIADGLVQRGLAEQSANLGATLRNAAYGQGLTLAQQQAQNNNTGTLGALQTLGVVGNSAAGTGVNAGTSSVANQGVLSNEAAAGGAGLTAAQQAIIDNNLQKYQQDTTGQFAPLNAYMGIVGNNNWGSQTQGSGTSNTTSTPSAWDVISGLLSSGGSAAGGLGAMGKAGMFA
jgi:hypothetical protein